MTNINHLEREWKLYKRKQRLPYLYVAAALVVLSFLISLGFFFTEERSQKAPLAPLKNEINTTLPKAVQTEETPHKEPAQNLLKQEPVSVINPVKELQPSFRFMQNIQETPSERSSRANPKHQLKKEPSVTQEKKVSQKTQEVREEHQKRLKQNLEISSSSAETKINTLIQRFNQTKNPTLGITIAQHFLRERSYRKSYFYALEVNNIDQNNMQSWLISAKSLYFLGRKEAARQLIRTYMKRNDSSPVSKLYRQINLGTLKP